MNPCHIGVGTQLFFCTVEYINQTHKGREQPAMCWQRCHACCLFLRSGGAFLRRPPVTGLEVAVSQPHGNLYGTFLLSLFVFVCVFPSHNNKRK